MIFGSNKRQKRQVRRNGEEGPPLDREGFPAQTLQRGPKVKRTGKWKWLLVIFGLILLILSVSAGASYLYVKAHTLEGEKTGRVNILVMGVDSVATLSDTIMILSINTRSADPQVAIVSLPRDLFLNIPEFGQTKINAAYTYGENNDYPGGGPGLTKDTIETNIDIPIHYYLTMDFAGFKQLVDAVGGVDVEVKQDIDDPFYPLDDYSGTEDFILAAGPQHLDGETALKYARSRQTTTDFDRAARQQQIILAFKDKVVDKSTLYDRQRVSNIRQVLEQHLKTDIDFRDAAKIGLILYGIKDAGISRHVIDTSNYLRPLLPGASALVPTAGDFSEISDFFENVFTIPANNLPQAQR